MPTTGGISSSIELKSRIRSRRLPTSHATGTTVAPGQELISFHTACSSLPEAKLSRRAPDREIRTKLETPSFSKSLAVTRPKPPRPPVITYVPVKESFFCALKPTNCECSAPDGPPGPTLQLWRSPKLSKRTCCRPFSWLRSTSASTIRFQVFSSAARRGARSIQSTFQCWPCSSFAMDCTKPTVIACQGKVSIWVTNVRRPACVGELLALKTNFLARRKTCSCSSSFQSSQALRTCTSSAKRGTFGVVCNVSFPLDSNLGVWAINTT
mmetsp:Transcript_6582/g.11609  ORF Transcript_6582/g.11609 Transcript_6582/m.11609 type:complete len:268 (+) Transcript_6582:1684-2487(+)